MAEYRFEKKRYEEKIVIYTNELIKKNKLVEEA